MKIHFGSITNADISMQSDIRQKENTAGGESPKKSGVVSSFDGSQRAFGKDFGRKSLLEKQQKTMEDLQTKADGVDVRVLQNQMTLCSQTMSQKDYERMTEEGFDPSRMEPGETVTILDHIKAQLILSGENIIGYTDSIDLDSLAKSVGSVSLARSIVENCGARDIPLTQENMKSITEALQLGREMEDFSEESYVYLMENHLEPSLYHLTLASAGSKPGADMVTEGPALPGEELERFLAGLTLEASEENVDASMWLLKHDLEVSPKNIEIKKTLDNCTFPLEDEVIVKMATAALCEGKEGVDGSLLRMETSYEIGKELCKLDSRIHLEEVRLWMTSDANRALLSSDYSIDPKPMEDMLEQLKSIRRELAEGLFPKAPDSMEKYDCFEETKKAVQDIREMPMDYFGYHKVSVEETTLSFIQKEGNALKQRFQEAGESYETMMTKVRPDLGDRLKDAFRNVDDILDSLELERNEINRKSVRTLAYCHMEINREQVMRVREGISNVQGLVERMTPQAVLKMIRDGVNPLEESVGSLKEYFGSLQEDYSVESEKYSRFLYHLEQKGQITPEEKESFLGSYRLLRQIEKSDGALIGDLIQTGAEFTMKNLLTFVRTRKGMEGKFDVLAGDTIVTGELKNSISVQIESAYDQQTQNKYRQEQYHRYLENLKNADTKGAEVLNKSEMPMTTENILAAGTLKANAPQLFRKLRQLRGKKQEMPKLPRDFEEFQAGHLRFLSGEREGLEEETLEQDSYLDVREMQLMHKQLSIMENLSKKQDYYFPLETGQDKVVQLHLTFVEDGEKGGRISLHVESEELGEITGRINLLGDKVTGYLIGNQEKTINYLEERTDIISENLPQGITLGRLDYIYGSVEGRELADREMQDSVSQNPEVLYQVSLGILNAILE